MNNFTITNNFTGNSVSFNFSNAEEAFKNFIIEQKREIIHIYTDGSCFGNNSKNKKNAGIGVYWGENDPRNISEPLPEEYKKTNNVAELVAIRRALDCIDNEDCKDCDYEIYTDSQYSINSITKWIKEWKKNGWKKKNGKNILNLKLIQDIHFKYIELLKKYKIRFIYIEAHTNKNDINSLGNKEADKLAKAGATRS